METPGVHTLDVRQTIGLSADAGAEPRAPASAKPDAAKRSPSIGIGIEAKLFFFLIVVLGLLALVAAAVSTRQMTAELTDEFESKGVAIATGLASASGDPLERGELAAVQRLVDRFAEIEGVAYVLVYDAVGAVVADTFAGGIPETLAREAAADGGTRQLAYVDPASSQVRSTIDVASAIAGGALGSVRIGMDRDQIVQAARDGTTVLVITLGATALIAAFVGLLLTRRTVRPIRRLVSIARRVGRGDLSELAPVQSSDEIGLLARTFNDSITRLRGQVQTEEERDEERRKREQLQANISSFLDVATAIAEGNLTLRGEVTADVLGAVVDSINVMVEEIAETLQRVRQAASTVTSGAQEMIGSTERMVSGAQTQSREATRVRDQVAAMSRSMREVAERASSSADAARQTRQAADSGQQAVDQTLRTMQAIRREVQAISKRVKGLGERSMEISEIVETISTLASQTNLLALNAAIEASGAGEYGARFTVVADEVRKLAEDSARAAKRVGSLIKAVQTEVQEAVVAMEDGTQEVEAGFRVNTTAGERLLEIAQISGVSAELAAQISSSASAQVAGVDEVAGAVASISEIATGTEKEVLEGRRVAEQLLGLSDELNRLLDRFQLAS
jgi:twitching motility protein PilJ